MKTIFSVLMLSTSGIVACSGAMAQDVQPQADQASGLDIVVTAQRRAERVQEVPIGISVVSADQLDRQQVTQLSDLQRSSASIQFGSPGAAGGGGGGAFIRGIGTASLSRGAESAVGVVVDGVVQGNTNVNNLFDISRVEVLRGPQGTLFGQSVSAGVVNITTVAPDTNRISGKVTTELSGNGFAGSEYGKQIVRAALNLPVSDESALRISAYGSRTNGVLNNVNLDRSDRFEEQGIRARYLTKLGEGVTLNLIGDYNHYKGRDGQFFTYIQAIAPSTIAGLAACGVVARPGNLDHCSSAGERQTGDIYGGSAQIDAELGSLTLTSITGYRESILHVSNDVDRIVDALNPGNDVYSGVRTAYSQVTQELRLATDPSRPFSATIGGFFIESQTTADQNPTEGSRTYSTNGTVSATIFNQHTKSRSISAFGEGNYKAGQFTFFAGARLNRNNLDYEEVRQNFSYPDLSATGPRLATDYGYNDTDFSWRVGGRYEPSRNLMIYATVARGYKNAQLSPILPLASGTIFERVVLPEKPMAYEVGVKSTMLNGRLAVNVNAFYQRVKDLQGQTFVTLVDNPVPTQLPTNVSKVISKGIEADIFGRIGSYLTVNASATYNVAEYPGDYFDGNNVSLKGKQIAFAPRIAANLSAEYARPISGDVEGFISLDARHRGKTRMTDLRIASAQSVDPARWIFGGRVGARVDDQWSVAVFANNIGASRIASLYNPVLFGSLGAFYSTASLRQVGLQAQFEF